MHELTQEIFSGDKKESAAKASEVKRMSPWVWTTDDTTRPLVAADSEETSVEDFRLAEVMETIKLLLEERKRVVFVRAHSGFGISKFFIPKLKKLLTESSTRCYHIESLDKSYRLYDEDHDIFIIDEIQQSSGGLDGGLELLTEILSRKPNLQAVVLFDDTKYPNFRASLELMGRSPIGVVEMHPKLLSISQATAFAMEGPPFINFGSNDTFFEGLTQEQTRIIIEAFSKRFPLHFRLLGALRDNTVRYDWYDISFEERLNFVQSKEIEHLLEQSFWGNIVSNSQTDLQSN